MPAASLAAVNRWGWLTFAVLYGGYWWAQLGETLTGLMVAESILPGLFAAAVAAAVHVATRNIRKDRAEEAEWRAQGR